MGLRTKFSHTKLKWQRRWQRKSDGVNLVGYFSSTFGVAEVGRFFAKRLIETGIPFSVTNFHSPIHKQLSKDNLAFLQPGLQTEPVFYKTIFFINAAEIPHIPKQNFIERYNAAVFFWEFDDYFHFPEAFKPLNEIIVFTDFIAKAVRKTAPKIVTVTKLTFPFIQNWRITSSPETMRQRYNIPQDAFVFFFNFDFHSIFERKNPSAILKAMDLAFTSNDHVRLVFKTIHAEQKGGDAYQKFDKVLNQSALSDKVIMINESMERNDFMSLVNCANAYISLHRSEGLGLGMMESMSMGKPVIGTSFGGNLDFMNHENSLLVDYTLVPLEHDEPPYKKGWLWAEADVKQAAAYMRKLYDDKEFGVALGKKAKTYIETKYTKDIFLREVRNWLQLSTN